MKSQFWNNFKYFSRFCFYQDTLKFERPNPHPTKGSQYLKGRKILFLDQFSKIYDLKPYLRASIFETKITFEDSSQAFWNENAYLSYLSATKILFVCQLSIFDDLKSDCSASIFEPIFNFEVSNQAFWNQKMHLSYMQ